MVYSLIQKRLNGFASCLGLIVSLAAFFGAIVLPGQLALMELWSKLSWIPDPIRIIVGLIVPILFLIVPFWLLFRIIRLTNQWLYPKIFKPLEAKL